MFHTCGRGAGTHGDVLNAHTEGVLNVHTVSGARCASCLLVASLPAAAPLWWRTLKVHFSSCQIRYAVHDDFEPFFPFKSEPPLSVFAQRSWDFPDRLRTCCRAHKHFNCFVGCHGHWCAPDCRCICSGFLSGLSLFVRLHPIQCCIVGRAVTPGECAALEPPSFPALPSLCQFRCPPFLPPLCLPPGGRFSSAASLGVIGTSRVSTIRVCALLDVLSLLACVIVRQCFARSFAVSPRSRVSSCDVTQVARASCLHMFYTPNNSSVPPAFAVEVHLKHQFFKLHKRFSLVFPLSS